MSERETAQAIHDRAAEWVARIDRAGGDPDTQAALAAWLAGDPRRQGAYFRAQVVWQNLDRASVLRGGVSDPDPPLLERRLPDRRQVVWGGLAAAGVAAIVGGVALRPAPAEHIETALGEIRRVPLADGSMAAVNTQTALAVRLKPALREIALDRGEAWFQVAHDKARPFIVSAGDVRVHAVGTAFSVRRMDAGADVKVTEGVVEVWSVNEPGAVQRVAAGARTFVSDVQGPQRAVAASTEIDRALAWRNGQLVFDGDTLDQAAAEFNRYNRIQVEIGDAALGQEKMVGRFRTNEPDAFARAAATVLGAHAEIGTDHIRLSRN